MSITLPNHSLAPIAAFLDTLPLAGAASRARSKVAAMIASALESLAASELDLAREHAKCEDGNPVIDADGHLAFASDADARAFLEGRADLYAERAILSGQSYEQMAPTLHAALLALETPLSGADATAYDQLCDALEAHLAKENHE